MAIIEKGSIKFYRDEAWGFIENDLGESDCFFKRQDLLDHSTILHRGTPVQYERIRGKGGPRAINIKKL